MPRFDRQGPPNGEGNQSGRRMGKCNPETRNQTDSDDVAGRNKRNKNPRLRMGGMQGGRARGLGRRHRAWTEDSDSPNEQQTPLITG